MRFTIVGAGAIGGIMGAGLAQHGASVLLVDRDVGHVEAIVARGLTIEGEGGTTTVRVPAVLPDRAQGPLDVVIVAVKSQDTAGVLRWLVPLLTSDNTVVSLQNGLNHEAIANAVGRNRTVGAFVNYQASYLGPGHIQFGRRGSLYLGEMDGVVTTRIRDLQAAMHVVRPTAISRNIHGLLWSKLAYGAMLIATALVDAPALDVLQRYPRVMGFLAAEVIQVGRAAGVRLEEFDVFAPAALEHPDSAEFAAAYDRILRSWEERPIKYTGIWRDLVVRRRQTEVPFETGVVVERGAAVGVPAPLNARLTAFIREIESGERPMAWANLDELQALVGPDRHVGHRARKEGDMRQLGGQAALVTGAATGMGLAIAQLLAREGASVLLVDVNDATTQAGEIAERFDVRAMFVRADITLAAEVEAAARTCVEQFGRIDILVNVAGGALAFGFRACPLEDTREEDFRRVVDINLHGPFLVTRAVIAQMKRQEYGRILLISSGAGRSASRTGIHAYAAAKAGLLGFVRQLAREVGSHGITVNSVAPGLISNPRVLAAWESDTPARRQAFFDGVAINPDNSRC